MLKYNKNQSNPLFFLITVLVIALSGFPIVQGEMLWILSFVLLFIVALLKNKHPLKSKAINIVLFIVILSFLQSIVFGSYNFYGFLGYLLRILIALFSIFILRENFFYYYIKVIKLFAIISLVIFIPTFLFHEFAYELNRFALTVLPVTKILYGSEIIEGSLGIYHFNRTFLELVRNGGPFWEPGAFGGYLILALIINTVFQQKLKNNTNTILFVTIITTFSTTTYLALFVFVVAYFVAKSNKISYAVLGLLFFIISFFAFNEIPFLKEKVQDQYETYQDAAYYSGGGSRFGAAYLDILEFINSPIVGRGLGSENRNVFFGDAARRHNGITGFLNSWGIFLFVIYWLIIYRIFKYYSNDKLFGIVATFTWALSNFSEVYFNLPIFWILFFSYWAVDINKEYMNEKNFSYKSKLWPAR